MRPLRLRSVLFVLAASAVLAACGEQVSPRERLAAAEAMMAEGSAAFTMRSDMEMGEEGSGMNVSMTGEGALDLAAQRGRMAMEMPGMGASLEMVFDSSEVYVRMPPILAGGETRWVRGGSGSPGMRTGGRIGGDPGYVLDVLGAVEGEISELGSDTVRGTDVRGYGFTVSGSQLWTDQGEVPRAMAETEVPVQAWLDGQDRLRRMVMELDLSAASRAVREEMTEGAATEQEQRMAGMMGSVTGTLVITTDFYDFGTAVEVEFPDTSEVMDAELFQQRMMERSSGG